jgi:acetyl esterase
MDIPMNFNDLIARIIQKIEKRIAKPTSEITAAFNGECAVKHITVDTSVGAANVALYRPANAADDQVLPLYINIHGGGYVMRYPEQDDHICRYIADRVQCIVASIDYDVAPQARYPAAPIQCFEVSRWLVAQAATFAIDSQKIAAGGFSAGAVLSTGVALQSAQTGAFKLSALIAVYPPADLAAEPSTNTSKKRFPLISPFLARVFSGSYIPDIAKRSEPLASPTHADNLSALPDTMVITAELDTLRAEGDLFAEKIKETGVAVEHFTVRDADHFFTHQGTVAQAREAFDPMVAFLQTRLT